MPTELSAGVRQIALLDISLCLTISIVVILLPLSRQRSSRIVNKVEDILTGNREKDEGPSLPLCKDIFLIIKPVI